jgi:hypothetical protein
LHPPIARWIGVTAAIVALAGVTHGVPSAHAHRGGVPWTLQLVMSRIDGATVPVERWHGRIQSATTLCNGEGRGAMWAGARHWRHFTCTWTVFRNGSVIDRDVSFRVHAVTKKRFVISSARFGAD